MNNICPKCGAMVRPGASFCGTCREPLAPSSALTPSSGTPVGVSLWTDDGRQFPLTAPITYIGRDPSNDVSLADARVSGRHAKVVHSAAGYVLRDLGSRNGSYVNGQRIAGDCPLADGDVLLVGGTRLTFRQQGASPGGAGLTPRTQAIDPADVQSLWTAAPRLQSQPPAPWPGGGPGVQSSLQPSPAQRPATQSAPAGFWASLTAPDAVGPIAFEPTEAQEQPPTDVARVLVMLAVTLVFLEVIGAFIAVMLTVGLVLLCLGAGALLFVVPLLLQPLQMLFSSVMGGLREQKPITVVRFRVEDGGSGQPVDVVLMRKQGQGGGLHQGDRVQVWGRRRGGTLYAHKVRIEGSGATIRARKPWPLWIGILALAGVVGSLVYLAVALDLIQL